MTGAIIGDIAGSAYEWHPVKDKNFNLFSKGCRATDDTIMTLAICLAFCNAAHDFHDIGSQAISCMQKMGRLYPHAGYGGRFRRWLTLPNPQPYNSFGNGSAMRVSPCAYVADSLEQCLYLAEETASVTHNHPEGVKGAQATAAAIFLARTGASKNAIRDYINARFYPIDFSINNIRLSYRFDASCQGSVPQAIACFLESSGMEDAIRNAISLGGDSDTQGAIAGSIAEAFYGTDMALRQQALNRLDDFQRGVLLDFETRFPAARPSP